jgi:hypothetical protein
VNGWPGGRTIRQPQTVEIDDTTEINCEFTLKDCCTACVRAEVAPGLFVVYRCVRPAHAASEDHRGMAWDRVTNRIEASSSHEPLSWIVRDGRPIVIVAA